MRREVSKKKGKPAAKSQETSWGHVANWYHEHVTESDARAICKQYNDTHNPGRLSRKAEYERN